jgi:hypothetical protein
MFVFNLKHNALKEIDIYHTLHQLNVVMKP